MMRSVTGAALVLLAGTPLSAQRPETFDHSLFDELLRAHVSWDGFLARFPNNLHQGRAVVG